MMPVDEDGLDQQLEQSIQEENQHQVIDASILQTHEQILESKTNNQSNLIQFLGNKLTSMDNTRNAQIQSEQIASLGDQKYIQNQIEIPINLKIDESAKKEASKLYIRDWKDRMIKQQQKYAQSGLLSDQRLERKAQYIQMQQIHKSDIKINSSALYQPPGQYDENQQGFEIQNMLVDLISIYEQISTQLTSAYQTVASLLQSVVISPREQLIKKNLKELQKGKNYASKDSGATILTSSSGVKNPKSVLSGSKEEYLILPSCKNDIEYSLVINLSEDVAVENIVISNHEEFSDSLNEIKFMGNIDYPTEKWIPLGVIHPIVGEHDHQLDVQMQDTQMIRYLKVVMKGSQDNELYCTITRIMVFGQGMHAVMRNSLMDLVNDQNQSTGNNGVMHSISNNNHQKQNKTKSTFDNAVKNDDQICHSHFKPEQYFYQNQNSASQSDDQLGKYFYEFLGSQQSFTQNSTEESIDKKQQQEQVPHIQESQEESQGTNELTQNIMIRKNLTSSQQQQNKGSEFQNATQLYNNDNALDKLLKTLVQKLNNNEVHSNQIQDQLNVAVSETNQQLGEVFGNVRNMQYQFSELNKQNSKLLGELDSNKNETVLLRENIDNLVKINQQYQQQFIFLWIMLGLIILLFTAGIVVMYKMLTRQESKQSKEQVIRTTNDSQVQLQRQPRQLLLRIEERSTNEGPFRDLISPIDVNHNHQLTQRASNNQDGNFQQAAALVSAVNSLKLKKKNKKKKQQRKNTAIVDHEYPDQDLFHQTGSQTVKNTNSRQIAINKNLMYEPHHHQQQQQTHSSVNLNFHVENHLTRHMYTRQASLSEVRRNEQQILIRNQNKYHSSQQDMDLSEQGEESYSLDQSFRNYHFGNAKNHQSGDYPNAKSSANLLNNSKNFNNGNHSKTPRINLQSKSHANTGIQVLSENKIIGNKGKSNKK
ncbi:UNKNOWN [Stylonychia lemnae]|uniref:SUN domain-containing protein n=1 Tax=Stylonychia lemnae TaxID=5949 RepID=A0A078BA80_STYLE|nr:UNKNOWN [Stylonychia lemnae]|eukprot:CDW90423.1 UNKNOWN [Stylonychia lemnae]